MLAFIIEDDKRGEEISRQLLKKGFYVSDSLKDMKYADFIYLGLKGIDRKHRIIHQGHNIVIEEDYFKHFNKNTILYTIANNQYLKELSLKYNFQYYSLMNDTDFIKMNTIMSIEGLISYLIDKISKPLYLSRILILGYGNCGQTLAKDLKAFHCDVSIALRNKQLKEEIEKDYHYLDITQLSYDYDVIINTIPYPILNEKEINNIDKKTKLIDIASYPYGIDHHYAVTHGYDSIILSSIPSLYYSKFSGDYIVDIMLKKGEYNA
jgi:dipicolinate synthase subunit A